MTDSQGPRLVDAPQFTATKPRQRKSDALSGALCQTIDLVILGAAFLGIAVLPGFVRDPGGAIHMLRQQTSVRGILIALMCAATWRIVLVSVGIYRPPGGHTRLDYIFRCFIGLNCCAAVVGLIEVVLRAGGSVWRLVAIYWLACLLLMAFARALLSLTDRLRIPR